MTSGRSNPAGLPEHVLLCEVGPRDGFQVEETPIPTDEKVAVIRELVSAGLRRIQVASFVHASRVPQMADAEEVCSRLPRTDGVLFAGLALNSRGVERARDAGLQAVDLSIATHDRHSLDNTNMTVADAAAGAREMIRIAKASGMQIQIGLQTVFGFERPGDTPLRRVLDLVRRFLDYGIDSVSLADTTGMASPLMVREHVAAVQQEIGDVPLALHLHDTRGLGLANVVAALEEGVTWFDAALGGLGGCPFIAGAAGNIATEDTIYLLEQMGISTHVNINAVAACSRRLERLLGRRLAGRMYRLV
jgi:hydroxymethylglutaryl-CoA lyase